MWFGSRKVQVAPSVLAQPSAAGGRSLFVEQRERNVTHDDREQVVEIMRDATGEDANRLEL